MTDDEARELRRLCEAYLRSKRGLSPAQTAHHLGAIQNRLTPDRILALLDELERLRELLDDAEPTMWRDCGCRPKKPEGWDGGDQWELRRYETRASERAVRCLWHRDYDALSTDGSET